MDEDNSKQPSNISPGGIVGTPGTTPQSNGQAIQSPRVAVGMDFSQAIRRVIDGKKITRPEWGAWYGSIHEERLKLFRPEDGKFVDWIVSQGDLIALDWRVVAE